MMAALPLAVALVALLYASVGHAGATGYIAAMALLGVDPRVIRPTALLLNVVVAAIGTVQFVRAGHFRADLFLPLVIASVPCAAIGGGIDLPTGLFEAVLGIVLLASAVRIVVAARAADWTDATVTGGGGPPTMALVAAGAVIGLLSGLTGVGGGVFLTPLLLAVDAAPVRTISAVTAPFILVNSLAGLAGGMMSGRPMPPLSIGLVAAAVVGGSIGATLGAFRLPVASVRLLMAVVLVFASVKLIGEAVWR